MAWLIAWTGIAMHLALVARCIATGAATRFPYFFTYLSASLFRTLAVLVARETFSEGSYALFYWNSARIISAFRFLVCWEVFRFAFPKLTPLRRVVGGVLVPVLAVLSGYFLLSRLPGTEKQVSLSVAAFLAVVYALTAYYAVILPRPIWGMGLGLGIYVSISLMNFSALAFSPWFASPSRWLRQFDFIVMMVIWIWALWSYRPQQPPRASPADVAQTLLLQWRAQWSNLRAGIKKAVGWRRN